MDNQQQEQQQEQVVAQPQQRTMNMSMETKRTADEFVGLINGLFEGIEALTTKDRPINDGEWLDMSNSLMQLHRFKDRFMTNVVVVEQVQRHQRGRVLNRETKTRQEKLQDPDNMACPKCLRIMTKRHYKEKHGLAGVCKAIEVVSQATAKSGNEKKTDIRRVKLSQKLTADMVYHIYSGERTLQLQLPKKPAEHKSSIYMSVLNIDEVFKRKECPDDRDVSGSCEYRKNAEGKWEKVVAEKPKIKITNRTLIKKKKVKLVVKNDDDAEA